MSATTHSNNDFEVADEDTQPVAIELSLAEAEALHTWLLKATADGSTSLEDPQVSAALTALSRTLDEVRLVNNVRRELSGLGVSTAHLSNDEVRELGRRVAQAVSGAA
jgi:hypothetical protein